MGKRGWSAEERAPGSGTGSSGIRDPAASLAGCDRIVIVGRTGSGKTTLGKHLAAVLGVTHVELDSLYFARDLTTVPLSVLRQRAAEAVAGDRWVTDGNKKAVRDLVWTSADAIIWLDYPLAVSLWRLARRASHRVFGSSAAADSTTDSGPSGKTDDARHLARAAKGVLTALRSHAGQRKEYLRLFSSPEYRHIDTIRLRSPRETARWLERVAAES